MAASFMVLAAMVTVAGCGGAHRTGGRHKLDLKIGVLVPISGVEQPFGATGVKATNLAVDEIRKAIKQAKADHTVSISQQNTRSDAQIATDLAGKMQRAGTSCIVGPWDTQGVIEVGSTIAIKKKIEEITPGATSDALAVLEKGSYVNRSIPPSRVQGEALATLISNELRGAKGKKVSIGALDNVYGRGLTESFSSAWRKLGGKISAQVLYVANLPDYKRQARELVAKNPDAYAFFDFQDTYTRIATELLKTRKWKANKTFVTDSLAVSTLGAAGGATAEGLRGVAPSWPRLGTLAQDFQRLWNSGPPPKYRQPYDTQAFDAVVLCYLSAVAAGSTKGSDMRTWVRRVSSPPGTKYTWRQLPQAIEAIEAGKDIDYQGASGPIDIEPLDPTGAAEPTAGFFDAFRIKDARLAVYANVSVPRIGKGVARVPLEYVTPRIPGVGPQPKVGPTGATGATGPKGAAKAQPKAAKQKKKKKSG
jgi:branched-chain amino acid transport system substrate-binding protein